MANIGVMPGENKYEYAYVKVPTRTFPLLVRTHDLDIPYDVCSKAVNGYIEIASAMQSGYEDIRIVVNDEGKIRDLPYNDYATYLYGIPEDYIAGDVLICGQGINKDGEPDIIPLPFSRAYDIWFEAVLAYLGGLHYGNHSAAAESISGSSQEG